MTRPELKPLIGLIIFTMLLTVALPYSTIADVVKEQDASIVGYGGAAATEDPDASKAAMTILEQGGNAVDAAVAAAAAQGVTRPYSGGLGGGGMMLIYLAEENRYITIDNRSAASEAFGPTAFINPETGLVYPEATRISSGAATSVPGAVKAWEEALKEYGTMTLKEVLQPAIEIAENGFIADSNYVRETTENANRFKLFESTQKVFLEKNGQVPAAGSIVKNPDLAHTYRLLAEHGSSVFYEGEIAEAIIETVNSPPVVENPNFSSVNSQWNSEFGVVPGSLTLEDLKNYDVITREPINTTYHDYEIYGVPPSSSGGITIGETLNILEAYQLSEMPRTQALHYYLEASRYAFADRRQYIGDPDFTAVPVKGLLSKGYATERRYNIQDNQATIGQIAPGNPWPYEENPDKTPEPPIDDPYAFSYSFIGNDGDAWDGSKFHRLDTGPQSSPYDAEFSLVDNGGRLKVNERKDGRGSAYGRATSNMEALANSQLDVRFKTDHLGSDQRLRFWLQADVWRSGSTTPNNGYGVEINAQTRELILYRSKNSSLKSLERIPFDLTKDWHDLRFKVEGNELTAHVWGDTVSDDDSDGEAVPMEWSLSHRLSDADRLDDQYGRFLISAINFEYEDPVSFYLDEARVTDLGEIEIPEIPEEPEEDTGHFVYDFKGEIGDPWDSSQFNLIEKGASFTIAEDGGEVRFHAPPGTYVSSFGKADPIMNNFTDGEVLLSFRLENPKETQNRRLRLWLRADDWSSARSTIVNGGYGAEIDTNSNKLILHSGSSSASMDHKWSEEWMYLKVRAEGNKMKARLWEKGKTEPAEWDVETTIEEKSGKVLMGFHGLSQSSLDGKDAFRIGELSIKLLETDEDTAAEAEISEADESTIHLAVSDKDGNIVSYTSTIVSIGGNGMVVPGYGFLLNNALYGRIPTQSPSHPNYPRPGMRSLSSMSPTLVMKEGRPVLTLGAPGSDTIITTVLQIILNNLEFGMPLSDAIAAPRISQRNNFNGLADYEEIFLTKHPDEELKETIAELEKMGHRFNAVKAVQGIGAAIGIEFLDDGRVRPATEPLRRGGGSAMVQSLEPIANDEKPGNGPSDGKRPITPPGHGVTPPGLGHKQPGPPIDPPGKKL